MSENQPPTPVILPRAEHCISRKNLDPDALKIMVRLRRHGFLAYLVGGSVRDLLLNRQPKDFDISTDAHPGQIKKLFRNSRVIGRRFRLVHVFFHDNKIIEVSTFRRAPPEEPEQREGKEAEPRKGDNTFGEPHEDALRRDLTINGLFYEIGSFSVLDYVGGIEDLKAGIIRTIGNPEVRFREDPLRMVRAVRYTIRSGFRMEPETCAAMVRSAQLLRTCNASRLQDEFQKDFASGAFCQVLRLQREVGLLGAYFPQLDQFLSAPAVDERPLLFDAPWFWRAMARFEAPAGDMPDRRFRLASLLYPLLERSLLEHHASVQDPLQHSGEIHGLMGELTSPVGVGRRDREGLQPLWEGWVRFLGFLESGRIPLRVQKKYNFSEILEWHRLYQEARGRSWEETQRVLGPAMQAGQVSQGEKRRRHRRRKPRPPENPDNS